MISPRSLTRFETSRASRLDAGRRMYSRPYGCGEKRKLVAFFSFDKSTLPTLLKAGLIWIFRLGSQGGGNLGGIVRGK